MHQHGGNIYQKEYKIDFSTNVNLFGIPEGVIRAAIEGVKLSDRYPDKECLELRTAISQANDIPIDQIICGNGAADLIYSLVLALKPKKALLPIPSFYEYEQAFRMIECKQEYYALKEEQQFILQKDILEAIKEDTDIIFLCNPNNPTGNLIEINIMEQIIHKCETYGIWLVVDECFMDFVMEEKCTSALKYIRNSGHLFILKAFTKLYAMPGMRLGYGICANQELLNRMKEVTQPWSVSIPAQMAGIAALKEMDYVINSLQMVERERNYLIEELRKLDFTVYGSRANYIFFYAMSGLYQKCLDRGMLIRDCSNYRGLKEGYYRIAVKRHEENEQLIEVMREVAVEWQKQL